MAAGYWWGGPKVTFSSPHPRDVGIANTERICNVWRLRSGYKPPTTVAHTTVAHTTVATTTTGGEHSRDEDQDDPRKFPHEHLLK